MKPNFFICVARFEFALKIYEHMTTCHLQKGSQNSGDCPCDLQQNLTYKESKYQFFPSSHSVIQL